MPTKKFIPNGDLDFVTMAESFARTIVTDPARFEIAPDEAAHLDEVVKRYRAAFQAARLGGGSRAATREKEDARDEAEQIIRRLGHIVRSNLRIDAATKLLVGIRERSSKPRIIECPQEPPRLKFVRALHENGATPMHELSFTAMDFSKGKPEGAVRLELFVDLIPPDEPIPAHPGANHGGRPWYLRSYTRSPIVLQPPFARVPMRVLYWGRWADSTGVVGPFSATAVAWIEGGTHQLLPGGTGMTMHMMGARKPVEMIEDATAREPGPADRDVTYRVAVMEVQVQAMQQLPPVMTKTQREAPRLEGPVSTEAA